MLDPSCFGQSQDEALSDVSRSEQISDRILIFEFRLMVMMVVTC